MNSPILTDFDARKDLYEEFRKYIVSLLRSLLENARIRVHQIDSRVKSRASIEEKLQRPGKSYAQLAELTDICGVRVIAYLAADVDAIGTLLKMEFAVDSANSTDKRAYEDPDKFGYSSLHYIISLGEPRIHLTECLRWTGLKVEVQVRTIIQHAWAEIEHDLGFKSPIAIPSEVKRRFARLAALLETADSEFTTIEQQISRYRQKVSTELQGPSPDIAINGPSVCELLISDPLILECESEIERRSGRNFVPIQDVACSGLAGYLLSVRIATVGQLHEVIRENKESIIKVAALRLSKAKGKMGSGITLLYSCYAVLARTGDPKKLLDFFYDHAFGPPEILPHISKELIAQFNPR